jgi:hypothetical protein
VSAVKTITVKDVKAIQQKICQKFTLVNMGAYIVITDNSNNESTSYTYDSNFVYLNFYKSVKIEYLLMVSESPAYFNWRYSNFDVCSDREKYLKKIIDKIIELSCGFKNK